jgi:hypothetical protein
MEVFMPVPLWPLRERWSSKPRGRIFSMSAENPAVLGAFRSLKRRNCDVCFPSSRHFRAD